MKKIRLPEIKTGIWLDQEKAYIIRIVAETKPVIEKIKSDVESRVRFAGEGKVFTRFGNAFIDDQEKKQRRQEHQRHRFFQEIIEKIHDIDFIYLFGPSEARHELNNEIEKNHSFKGMVVANDSADRMTENQMREKVLNFFESDSFRFFKKKLKEQKAIH